MSRWTRRAAVFAVGAAVVAAGCASTASEARRDLPPLIVDFARDAGADVAEVPSDRVAVVSAPALRLLLEELLSVHGTLTTQTMRLAAVDDQALQAWMDALAANTAELSAAIGLVYGPDGARAFDQLWTFHTQFFLNYADALRTGDEHGVDAAMQGLNDYRDDFASFLALATGSLAPEPAVADLLDTHIGHMIGQLDAYRDGDLASSLRIEQEGLDYLTTIGATLATAIAGQNPVAFPGDPNSDAVGYCSITGSRLGRVVAATTSSIMLPTRFESGETPAAWEAALLEEQLGALDGVATFLDAEVPPGAEGFDAAASEALIGLFDRVVPTPNEVTAVDVRELASLGSNLAGALPNPGSIPVIVRDAYARAYRLAADAHAP